MDRVQTEGDKRLFEVNEGLSLELAGVSNFMLAQWERGYEKRNPPPEVPLMEVKIAGKPIAKFDYNDPGYLLAKRGYESRKYVESTAFVITTGVLNPVPEDYVLAPNLVVDDTEAERKAVWLYSVLGSDECIGELMGAIMSINNATPEAIEDAEKNSEPEN